ncbi:hypothetical protein L207DRAFT_592751 [Hyaloscypha variabilis F]|uniref:Uncharacterized protein n=1 Tax=Hyaloscypha variabilis (strain UAMH 11265 / GT02V1 / F) TaxID=1149755 RepID=A0A2J6QVK2_HYAVF|nr:hypothetical protein L207DRAFT_592751 [Hyaloscypha variabilis F]
MPRLTHHTMSHADKVQFADWCYYMINNLDQCILVTKKMTVVADYPSPEDHPPYVISLCVQAKEWWHMSDREEDQFRIFTQGETNSLLIDRLKRLIGTGHAAEGRSVVYYHPDHHPKEALFAFIMTTNGLATPPQDQYIPDPDSGYLAAPIHAPGGGQFPFFGDRFVNSIPGHLTAWETTSKQRATCVLRVVFVVQSGNDRPRAVEVDLYMQIAPHENRSKVVVSVNASRNKLKELAGRGEHAQAELISGALFKFAFKENAHEDYAPPPEIPSIDPAASSSSSSPTSGSNDSPSPPADGAGPSTKRGRSASTGSGDAGKGKGKSTSGGMSGVAKKKTKS